MDIISILGYKIKLEFLILIGIIYLIFAVTFCCSCYNNPKIREGLKSIAEGVTSDPAKKQTSAPPATKPAEAMNLPTQMMAGAKEGFTGANTNYGESSYYSLSNNKPINTSSWFASNMVVTPGQRESKGALAIFNRKPQPVPLPNNEMLMFANTQFKPSCCPNTYSNSSGCACMTVDQYNWLKVRGGNNAPYSEY
jgi:hypothetical protein